MAIIMATKDADRIQKGEDKIVHTYPNADKAVKEILKRL